MNQKTANQIAEMKSQTFGVEVEMNNITRCQAATIAGKFFGRTSHSGSSGSTYYAIDNKGRRWDFTYDGSIAGTENEKCEMVTPILTYEDMETLQELLRRLRKAGAKSDPSRGCGVHVHIGARGHDAKSLRNLANLMASHESLLAQALNISQNRMARYCKIIDQNFLEKLNRVKPTTMAGLADIWYKTQNADGGRNSHYNQSRYHMLNLHATFTKGTIEFRLFQFDEPANGKQNGIHAGQMKSYIQLCLAMSQQAKNAKSASPREQQQENPRFALRTWLVRLGFIGDEFATAREVFTKRLNGNSAWRFGRE